MKSCIAFHKMFNHVRHTFRSRARQEVADIGIVVWEADLDEAQCLSCRPVGTCWKQLHACTNQGHVVSQAICNQGPAQLAKFNHVFSLLVKDVHCYRISRQRAWTGHATRSRNGRAFTSQTWAVTITHKQQTFLSKSLTVSLTLSHWQWPHSDM